MSTVNAWKYGREIYLIGRSYKFKYLSEAERASVIEFIEAIVESRASLAARLNLKYDNAGKELAKQSDYALLKMVQVIGRNLKVQFPTEAEKELCDALIESVKPRAFQGYNEYTREAEEVIEESSEEQEVIESSEEE